MSAPFGIEIGSSIDDYRVINEGDRHIYVVDAPRPHPSFESYLVQATPSLGVVWVKGVGYTIGNDAFGHRIRRLHDEVLAQLTKRYGPPEVVDLLMDGGIWTEPREWVMALTQGERFYFAGWERPRIALPSDLASVFLGVSADGNTDSWLVLEYASSNSAAADSEIQDDLSDRL